MSTSAQSYIVPPQRARIDIVHATPVCIALRMREDHQEANRLFRETLNVDYALKAQISKAIESQ